MKVFLIRPHPPVSILKQKTPIPEAYKYNWEPMGLKLIAYHILDLYGDAVTVSIWHLLDSDDDSMLFADILAKKPDLVLFSEIDILVNETDRLAAEIKKLSPNSWTIVGGKQTSLLAEHDHLPYRHIDYAIRGDGCDAAVAIIKARQDGIKPCDIPGLINTDIDMSVIAPATAGERTDISDIDGLKLREIPVYNHSQAEYLELHQKHPSFLPDKILTSPIFTGSGCPHSCVFCQSPYEYGEKSGIVKLRNPGKIADEMAWMITRYGANNFFSLEPNMCLDNLLAVYQVLEKKGITTIGVSGFIRAPDVLKASKQGTLITLIDHGMRFLSIGLDISPDSRDDVYHKSFSYSEMEDCLEICLENGIVVLGTFIADPEYTKTEMADSLALLEKMPLGGVDVRIAIALRNTEYYRKYEKYLVYHPDKNRNYYDRQNYRYQTIQVPGKISPRETYSMVRRFYRGFPVSDSHLDYVIGFVRKHPTSLTYFQRQYTGLLDDKVVLKGKKAELHSLLFDPVVI